MAHDHAVSAQIQQQLSQALQTLRAGGVIAYPTEYCFGLGCDPRNQRSVERLLRVKQRDASQGVILIAGDLAQVEDYAELAGLTKIEQIQASWPGANTWLLPAKAHVPAWVRGKHTTIAMRIPGHPISRVLCQEYGHAIVSTSANRHGQPALLTTETVMAELGDELDFVLDAPVGGAESASTIRDAITGQILR
ncbi:threonylcarbamoyl-AMP synthase [Arenicella chitinivorans]|uniref:Threonylcarbamoyl-AMP synthase n=1 Tax=Arenicella chitinivorans TaxID=1329800 RepID=A0A918VKD1_9GAMM|nr:L-threonylcarbamoyladenylate synthase [Arenicella chitinivorans]GHA03463.1 threonylcarbamoyl-AMP synthase [Arenicella chitinivorans]